MKTGVFFAMGLFLAVNANASDDPTYFGSCYPGEKSVTQSFVIDNKSGEAFGYNLRRMQKNSDSIGAVISIYQATGGDMKFTSKIEPSNILGHQGLAIEYIENNRYFWSSANKDYSPDSGNYAIRYRLESGQVSRPEFYKLFPEVKSQQSISPSISSNNKYLLVKMTRKKEHEIRVFELSKLKEGGDYSDKFKYSFSIRRDPSKNYSIALQGLASDGKFVYVLIGSMNVGDANRIDKYEMNGSFIKSYDMNLGEAQAKKEGSGNHYEPEWLTWINQGAQSELLLSIATGDEGARKCHIYKTGILSAK